MVTMMTLARIAELRTMLEAEAISYGELAEIESDFAELDPSTLRDRPENAMAADMLDELETAHARMAAERIAYTLTRLERWAGNFDANAAGARRQQRHARALELECRARDMRDIIKMLDGTEDAYIRQLRNV